MSPDQKQQIREKWYKRQKDNELWKITDSEDDIADFWLNEIDLAIKQTEDRIVEKIIEIPIEQNNGDIELGKLRFREQIITLIRNK